MKKRSLIWITSLCILILAAGVWWFVPSKIITQHTAEQVSYIKIGDGSSGKQYTVRQKEDVDSVMRLLHGKSIRKEKWNGAKSGFAFTLELYSKDDAVCKKITVLSKDRVVIGSLLSRAQGDTFDLALLSKLCSVNSSVEANAETTNIIKDFFSAFEKSDYTRMKTHCTKECIDAYFHDGDVFGMVWAKMTKIEEKPEIASENKYKVLVSVDMEPAKTSALYGGGADTSFYVLLKKVDSGSWLIDSFVTG